MLKTWRCSVILLACLTAHAALADPPAKVDARLIALVDPKFDAAHQRLSNGKAVVASAVDESHKDAPLLLLVTSEHDTTAADYDLYHDDTLSSRLYVARHGAPESQAVPFPSGPGVPCARLEHRADQVGSGADAITAVLCRQSETEGSSFIETVLRRLNDHLSAVFSSSYSPTTGEGGGTESHLDIATSPSPFAGFASYQLHKTITTCEPQSSACTSSVETLAYCWNGHDYTLANEPNCLVGSVAASSMLRERGSAHAPEQAVDGVIETAWCKAKKESAKGQWLQITLPSPTPLASLKIMPGFGKSDASWKNNDRISRATILVDAEPPREVSFTGDRALQDIALPRGHGPISTIRIQIVDVIPGAKFHDTCISEVALEAQPR